MANTFFNSSLLTIFFLGGVFVGGQYYSMFLNQVKYCVSEIGVTIWQ